MLQTLAGGAPLFASSGVSGAKFIQTFFLCGLMIPAQVIMIPLLQEFRWLNIQYTYFSLLLVYVAVTAGAYGYLEPAYMFRGKLQSGGQMRATGVPAGQVSSGPTPSA